MGVSKLAYIGANATDLAAWKKYSAEVMGLQIGTDSSDRRLYLRADERHHRLIIQAADKDDVAYVGWELANHEALETAASVLEKNGVKVVAATADELASAACSSSPTSSVRTRTFGWSLPLAMR